MILNNTIFDGEVDIEMLLLGAVITTLCLYGMYFIVSAIFGQGLCICDVGV